MRVRSLLAVGAAVLTVWLGTAGKLDKLESYERDHFGAMVVWFDDEKKETKAYLKNKTPETRDQWLKDNGYWDKFYQYDEMKRNAILGREPKIGWDQNMLYMAWGRPYRKIKATKRTAQNTAVFSYRVLVDKNGVHRVYQPKSKATYKAIEQYTQDITLDDRKITKIERKDGWF